jgi:hypothetical protein
MLRPSAINAIGDRSTQAGYSDKLVMLSTSSINHSVTQQLVTNEVRQGPHTSVTESEEPINLLSTALPPVRNVSVGVSRFSLEDSKGRFDRFCIKILAVANGPLGRLRL